MVLLHSGCRQKDRNNLTGDVLTQTVPEYHILCLLAEHSHILSLVVVQGYSYVVLKQSLPRLQWQIHE